MAAPEVPDGKTLADTDFEKIQVTRCNGRSPIK
jgi:hypothetical protein